MSSSWSYVRAIQRSVLGVLAPGVMVATLLVTTGTALAEDEHLYGRWVEPPGPTGYCWDWGAMHVIHLPFGKILLWYSITCPHPPEPHTTE